MKTDLFVIGGGPAGHAAAVRAAKRGMSVMLAERDKVGGTCLNRGCIPTKFLLHSSALFASRKDWARLGVVAENVAYDESAVYLGKENVVSALRGGIESLLGAAGVTVVRAHARIAGEREIVADGEKVTAEYVLVAAGSRPAPLPVPGAEEHALCSDGVLAAPINSDEVVIVGGGVVGCELACYFAETGRKVTVLEAADRLLPMLSKDISVRLAAALRRQGVTVECSARVTRIGENFVGFAAKDGEIKRAPGRTVVTVGRRAATEDLGLDSVGLTPGQPLCTDGYMRTSLPWLYAAGDARKGVQLAHYASASAINAVEHMCGTGEYIDLSVVPSLIYTHPEIAVVGDPARGVKSGRFMLGANGKSMINGSNEGFIRVFCDETGKLVASEAMGGGVTELAGETALAIKCGLTARDVASTVHAHPTLYESVAEACEDIFGLATNKK